MRAISASALAEMNQSADAYGIRLDRYLLDALQLRIGATTARLPESDRPAAEAVLLHAFLAGVAAQSARVPEQDRPQALQSALDALLARAEINVETDADLAAHLLHARQGFHSGVRAEQQAAVLRKRNVRATEDGSSWAGVPVINL